MFRARMFRSLIPLPNSSYFILDQGTENSCLKRKCVKRKRSRGIARDNSVMWHNRCSDSQTTSATSCVAHVYKEYWHFKYSTNSWQDNEVVTMPTCLFCHFWCISYRSKFLSTIIQYQSFTLCHYCNMTSTGGSFRSTGATLGCTASHTSCDLKGTIGIFLPLD